MVRAPVQPDQHPGAEALEHRILVLAPTGRDGAALHEALTADALDVAVCLNASDFCQRILEGAAAAVVGREALMGQSGNAIAQTLARQPEWSDFPLIVMSGRGDEVSGGPRELRREFPTSHLIVLERPVRRATLLNAVRAALQARTRQYQVRAELENRRRAQSVLRARERQQAAVASLGQRALCEESLQELLDAAVAMVAEVLDVELCKVLELQPSRRELLLRAGVGWNEGLVGTARVSAGLDSQAGYTLSSTGPVIVEDLRNEPRFSGPPLLREHGVVSGISCIVLNHGQKAWGVLGAHTRTPRAFTQDDVNFLRSVSNVLASAIRQRKDERALRESHERYAALVDGVDAVVFEYDPVERRFTFVSSRARELLGYSEERWLNEPDFWSSVVVHPEDREHTEIALDEAHRTRRDHQMEYRALRSDGAVLWLRDVRTFAREVGRSPMLVRGLISNVTERKRHEEQMQLVMAELNHRVKNTLAAVEAIARQTLRHSSDARGFSESFGERLRSLAKAHALLTDTNWQGATLRNLLLTELNGRVAERGQIELDGPEVMLRPKAALALHMALHELCTNAAKYGSLSVPDGQIGVHWSISRDEDAPQLVIEWCEAGGPRVEQPESKGFGSTVVEQSVSYELDGAVSTDFDPRGFRCQIRIPWKSRIGFVGAR